MEITKREQGAHKATFNKPKTLKTHLVPKKDVSEDKKKQTLPSVDSKTKQKKAARSKYTLNQQEMLRAMQFNGPSKLEQVIAHKAILAKGSEELSRESIERMIDSRIMKDTNIKSFLDYQGPGVDYGGILFQMATIGVGTGGDNRTGDMIEIEHIDLRYNVVLGDSTYNCIRVFVFQWHDISVPTPTVMFPSVIGTSFAPLCQQNIDIKQLYTVLHDETYIVSPNWKPSMVHHCRLHPRRKMNFQNTTSVVVNMVYILFISDSAAAPHPGAFATWDVRFIDA